MRTLNTTWKHIRRSPYQALAAIVTMFLTLLLVGIFFLTSVTSAVVLQYFEGKPQITVFFVDKAGKTEADALTQSLMSTGKVLSTKFVSKDDALAIYREQNKNDPLLLEMVTADILPASLEISATDPKYLSELEPIIKKADGVEEVVYQKDVVDTLLVWTNAIRIIGGVFAILLGLSAILTIVTVTSMKIALKKEEIEILRLVGASRWYIRFPFLLEGGLYGAGGAVLAWISITGLLLWIRPFLLTFLGSIPAIKLVIVNPLSTIFFVLSFGFLFGLAAIGFLLGCAGSLIATNRYLKF